MSNEFRREQKAISWNRKSSKDNLSPDSINTIINNIKNPI
jgi:hypothetical protein